MTETEVQRGGLWPDVVGQDAATSVLRAAVARSEVPHAWLFVGPTGVGQREAATALAADLNCVEATEPDGVACGRCSTCRRVAEGKHPAARSLLPEGSEHVVGSVREEWIPAATRGLVEGRVRVLRVVTADRMNEAAQNAFLKILEEPPQGVVWVLEAEDADALLDTIVSRCRRLDFAPWTTADLDRRAEQLGIPGERREALVSAAMGEPTRLEFLAGEGVAEARDHHLGLVGRLVDEGPVIAVPVAKELHAWAKERSKALKDVQQEELDRLEEAHGGDWPPGARSRVTKRHEREQREHRRRALRYALDDVASYLRDLVAVRSGAPIINLDHADALERDAQRVPPPAAFVGLQGVAEAVEALEQQGQPELHIERLLLQLSVAIYRAEA